MTKVIVHETKPKGFVAEVEVAATYVEVGEKFLLLQAGSPKEDGGLRGVPAEKGGSGGRG